MNLINFRKNIFSQNGEDGIIEEIIKRLELKDLEVCEFGAWDGKHLSNTFNLVKNFNARAVYIEGDKKKYQDLLKTAKQYPNILPINAFVSHKNDKNSLDNLLSRTFLKKDFDLLSIDIDGNDLEVFKKFKKYGPKIIIIEINSGYAPNKIGKYKKGIQIGTFRSTIDVAKKKGYTAFFHSGNIFFIKNVFLQKIKLEKKFINKPELLFNINYKFISRTKKFILIIKKMILSVKYLFNNKKVYEKN
jgi:hypothetical protein